MKDVDPALLAALGLAGLGLVGLGFSAGRSRSDDNLAQELDRFKEEGEYTRTMIHKLRQETYVLDSDLRGQIKELDQRTASRIWELEKRAGLAPGGDDNAD